MSSFLDAFDTDKIVLLAAEARKDYHRLRDDFYNVARRYYNQHTTCSYYTEDDMIHMLERLRSLKQSYKDLCDILKQRGMQEFGGKWESNDNLYKKDILHSI